MKKNILILFLLIFSHWSGAEMEKDKKIYIAGHAGLVGSAIVNQLRAQGYINILTRSHHELDLRNQQAVDQFFAQEKPDYVFLAAARVGGIQANMNAPADFLYDNLAIELNVIHAAYTHGVKKLLFMGSSCIYPRMCPQPIKEEYLLTGELEKSNEGYAIAKIAGLKLCEFYNTQHGTQFISCMPTNLYGPRDNFNLQTSHVLPALIRKLYTAKKNNEPFVNIWGTGNVFREFLYIDDLADCCLFLMNTYEGNQIVNVGTGKDITIGDLARMVKKIVGFEGELIFDSTKPEGTPRKLLNVDRINELGWHAQTSLEQGIKKTFDWCIENTIFE
jgi:GDP-L-fucose synthase